jgi:hypothetical protein
MARHKRLAWVSPVGRVFLWLDFFVTFCIMTKSKIDPKKAACGYNSVGTDMAWQCNKTQTIKV